MAVISKPNQPFDFLEHTTEILKGVIDHNYAKNQGEYRPLEEFDKVSRDIRRDFLRNWLLWKDEGTPEEIEDKIKQFEIEVYGIGT